ncbi:hypothetical protein [Cypionkella sp.]|uniref:hypothetical protein n=1 Tax=Cypionkella sp. TaxID=2811411 RepID=UPI002AB96587|nr:hypothetical protein [Cypionkella sp.]MDZ4393783.1 hypothetical protein [Cypionkella sp.]
MTNIAEALVAEIKRMNDVVIPAYQEIVVVAPMTAITVAILRAEVDAAMQALAEGDVIKILQAYATLKENDL